MYVLMQADVALDVEDNVDALDVLDDRKHTRPCWGVTFIVRHTGWSLLLIVCVVVPAGVHVYEAFDSIHLNIDLDSYRVEGDVSTDNYDTLQAIKPFSFAAAQTKKSFRTLSDGQEQLEQPVRIVFLGINDDEDLLDEKNLKLVRSIENRILQNPLWRRYCRQRADGDCEAFDSITKVLYPSSRGAEIVFDGKGEKMMDRDKALDILIRQSAYGYFDRQFSPTNLRSKTLVAFTLLVPPQPSTASDGSNIIDGVLSELRPFFSSLGGDRIQVLYEGGDVLREEVRAAVGNDVRLVLPSFVFVFIFISLSMGSPFLAVAGCLSIVLSFVPAVSLYLVVFGGDFSILMAASIWIILGVGTDDIFVFNTMWKQSEHKVSCSAGDLARRLSWTMRHAGKTMFVTSFTTAVAFFSTMTTRIKAVSEFGGFMGALVVFNYIFAMSLFPCCVILYEKRIRRLSFCPAWFRRSASYKSVRFRRSSSSASTHEEHAFCLHTIADIVLNSYANLLTRHRWLFLLVFLSLTAVMASRLPRMKPAAKLPKILKSDSNIERLRWVSSSLLQTCDHCTQSGSTDSAVVVVSDPSAPVDPVDDIRVTPSPSTDCPRGRGGSPCSGRGSCVARRCSCDSGFKGVSCELQCPGYRLLSSDGMNKNASVCSGNGVCVLFNNAAACECAEGHGGLACEMGQAPTPKPALLSPDNSLQVSLVFGVRGIERPETTTTTSAPQPIWDKHFDMAADAEILSRVCQRVLELDNVRVRGDLFRCLFNDLKEFAEVWPVPRENFTQTMKSFLSDVGEAYQDQIGIEDGAAFWHLDIVTLTHNEATAAVLEHEFDEWQNLAHIIDEMVPTRVFQASSVWPRMRLEKELVKGSLLSCGVTIAISALSLLLFSRSFIIAFMGVVTATFVLVCVCGVLQLLDWSFGVVEALSLSMLVGYSVDYQMHIGHVYATSNKLGRIERVQDVIGTIGAPIFASSFTTAGSAAFLLFCSVSIFVTFGVIVSLTATFSLLFAIGFLTAALAVSGPVQNKGKREAHDLDDDK